MTPHGLNDMVPAEALAQLSKARDVIERHLKPTLLGMHLYGSAVTGGLKPESDIDLLVTVAERLDDAVRQALFLDLLDVSAPPDQSARESLRALEVTVIVQSDIVPWRYPARRELQFGEWLREDIAAGIFEPAVIDLDLAILVTKARQHSIALVGPSAEELLDPVPEADLFRAITDTLKLWNAPADWAGDERHVVLTLARIWHSAATGTVVPKDVAADWALARLPKDLRPVLAEARQVYLGLSQDRLASRAKQLAEFVNYVKGEAASLLKRRISNA